MYDANTGRVLVTFPGAPTTQSSIYSGPWVVPPASSASNLSATFGSATLFTESQPEPNVVAGGGQGNLATWGGASGGGTLLEYITGYGIVNGIPKIDWLACWNATQAVCNNAISLISSGNNVVWTLPAAGSSIPWKLGLQWNVTFPYVPTGSVLGLNGIEETPIGPLLIDGTDGNVVLVSNNALIDNSTGADYMWYAGFNANTGAMLYQKNDTLTPYAEFFGNMGVIGDGIFTINVRETMSIQCYSLTTGNLLWTCQPYANDFASQSMSKGTLAYGNLYVNGYDGYMHCINVTTGKQTWETISQPSGLEMPEENYPLSGATVADGKVYSTTSKSYETEPLYRGHLLYCYDAYTGQQLWNVSGQIAVQAIAYGILLGTNAYDGKLYAFSAGPTATTVTAPMTEVTAGSNVVIQGTVTDQSPGAKGTPAISDQYMTPWMNYLYMDQPKPTQATGVPVSIDAIDPNGNYIHIGNATSDISGVFGYKWTPPNIPGQYTIIATFGGSNSYYGSSSETVMTITSPTTTAAPTATPTSTANTYFVPAIAGLFVFIAVVAVVLAMLMLRKRP
jgi:putative pyrroloquinoline-quinone binding quinoprotein